MLLKYFIMNRCFINMNHVNYTIQVQLQETSNKVAIYKLVNSLHVLNTFCILIFFIKVLQHPLLLIFLVSNLVNFNGYFRLFRGQMF